MNKFKVNISGMTCTGCEKHVESALEKIGAKNIESSYRRGEAVFELPDDIEVESAIKAIAPTSTLKLFGLWHYSQNYGVIFTAYGIGAIIGVLSSGLLFDLFGHYEYIFYYIIALAVVGLILIKVWMTPHENNKIQAN